MIRATVKGNILVAATQGALGGLAFWFFGIKGALLWAVAMGFLDSPEKAVFVAVAFFLIQFMENHLLIPLLMKGGVDVPPALTILSQALMALLFGFLGLMVAVPILAGAALRIVNGFLVDMIGPKKTGALAQAVVIIGLLAAFFLHVDSYGAMLAMGGVLGMAGASFAVALPLAGAQRQNGGCGDEGASHDGVRAHGG